MRCVFCPSLSQQSGLLCDNNFTSFSRPYKNNLCIFVKIIIPRILVSKKGPLYTLLHTNHTHERNYQLIYIFNVFLHVWLAFITIVFTTAQDIKIITQRLSVEYKLMFFHNNKVPKNNTYYFLRGY